MREGSDERVALEDGGRGEVGRGWGGSGTRWGRRPRLGVWLDRSWNAPAKEGCVAVERESGGRMDLLSA